MVIVSEMPCCGVAGCASFWRVHSTVRCDAASRWSQTVCWSAELAWGAEVTLSRHTASLKEVDFSNEGICTVLFCTHVDPNISANKKVLEQAF